MAGGQGGSSFKSCRPPGRPLPPRRKEPASTGIELGDCPVCRDNRGNQQAQEKNVGLGGRRNHTPGFFAGARGAGGISLRQWPLAVLFSSRPPDDTQPWKRGRERYTEERQRLLTVGWMPAHGVQVEVAVMEEKLVL